MNDFSNLSAESPESKLAQVQSNEVENEPLPSYEELLTAHYKGAIATVKTLARAMSAENLKSFPLVAK